MVPTSKVGKITSSPVRILNFQRQIPGAFSPHIAHASVTSEARHQRVFAFQVDARLGSVASHSWRSRHKLFLFCGARHTQKAEQIRQAASGPDPASLFRRHNVITIRILPQRQAQEKRCRRRRPQLAGWRSADVLARCLGRGGRYHRTRVVATDQTDHQWHELES